MESKYKEILLMTGLENFTDEELKKFKFFISDEFEIPRCTVQTATRTDLADEMIQKTDAESALTKTIRICRKLNYMNIAKALQEAKKEVESKSMTNTKKKETQQGKRRGQSETHSVASATSRDKACKKQSATKVCPQAKDLTLSRRGAGQRQGTKPDVRASASAVQAPSVSGQKRVKSSAPSRNTGLLAGKGGTQNRIPVKRKSQDSRKCPKKPKLSVAGQRRLQQ